MDKYGIAYVDRNGREIPKPYRFTSLKEAEKQARDLNKTKFVTRTKLGTYVVIEL